MMQYDETVLVSRLQSISAEFRVLFALQCSSRLYGVYVKYMRHSRQGRIDDVQRIVERLWKEAPGSLPETVSLESELQMLEGEMSVLESNESPVATYAADALAALSYVIRTRMNGSPQEAAWAARRVYESFDQWAIRNVGLPETREAETDLLRNPAIQEELQRQERDLSELEAARGLGTIELCRRTRARSVAEGSEAADILCPST